VAEEGSAEGGEADWKVKIMAVVSSSGLGPCVLVTVTTMAMQ